MTRERIGLQNIGDLCRQAIETFAEIDRPTGQIDPRGWCDLDHEGLRVAATPRRGASSPTPAPPRNCPPLGSTISMRPVRPPGAARSPGRRSAPPVVTVIGTSDNDSSPAAI